MHTFQNTTRFVVLRIYVALAVFQPYRDLEAGDNQSLKFKWRGGESNPGPLAPQANSGHRRSYKETITTFNTFISQLVEGHVN